MNNTSLPHNQGQPTRFPSKPPKQLLFLNEFRVDENGKVLYVSPWLTSQTRQFDPGSRNLTGQAFMERAVAWFKRDRKKVIARKYDRRKLVDANHKPIGLVSVSQEMELALAHAGLRMRA